MTDSENLPPRRSTRLRSTTAQPPSHETSNSSTVSPLRISKSNSKSKTLSPMTDDTSLRDISPGSSRRNSPSAFQIKDKMADLHTSVTCKSPPATPPSASTAKSESTSSVRNFWKNGGSGEESSEQKRKSESEDLRALRSSYVKNNIFVANDIRERESSPKLTMSPSQHRLSNQLGEPQVTPTTSPSKIPTPVNGTQSPRMDAHPMTNTSCDVTPKASCLHSNRIKGPRQNASDSDSPTPLSGRRERRKTVTFDEAPQVLQFDRRSSHGTTSSEQSSTTYADSGANNSKPESDQFERSLPPRPLPQVPPHAPDDDRPSSKESNESDFGDMEERIRSMMERVVLRDSSQGPGPDEEDIFSLYTTTNEMDESSQDSTVFSSQGTTSTTMSSQVNSSQDEELERQLALQKQSEELLNVVKTRPFSLAELPSLEFGDDGDEDLGGGLGLREYCSSESKPEKAQSPFMELNNSKAIPEETVPFKQESQSLTPPITPPLESSEISQTPQEQRTAREIQQRSRSSQEALSPWNPANH